MWVTASLTDMNKHALTFQDLKKITYIPPFEAVTEDGCFRR